MKRLSLVVVLALAVVIALPQVVGAKKPPASKDKKVTICHRTGSESNPYVRIRVSKKAVKNGHGRHASDIIPAPKAGCPSQPMSPTSGGTVLAATLLGAHEVPGPGDPDGAGQAEIRLTAGEGRVCFRTIVTDITLPATGAHIHVGGEGTSGDIVISLTPPDATGTSSGCIEAPRSTIKKILDNPAGYYVNVHTTDFPDGSVRGQLSK